ncbi:hypothetical protein PBAC_32100 [Pedobacter glucosidilyticus]|nr:hypothetical protein [Pedobacter glucosidilyticus]KHJ36621.1 hypothetical protein PBAC_32100 [Pedobacter glucosidilyticus]
MIKSVYFKLTIITLLSSLNFGCEKDLLKKENIDPKVTYKGVVLAKQCPSYAIIQIIDKNIGYNWVQNSISYDHVIAISNLPEDFQSDSIFLSIDTTKFSQDCIIQNPCQQIVTVDLSSFERIYCASKITSN